ncbi:MAG: acyltransferase family protein [Actinomycetota bacterium]
MTRGQHIPALDGLRGLAVASVVVYHAWPSVLPGGWIGVSVFFTLSGFLITTIVARDHELTRASLGAFWRRRARRLLPAALVTIAATVLAVVLVDADRVPETAEAGLAATLYVHNWYAAGSTEGYWQIFETSPSPLAHMWSLAIEEQVYLVWPLVVLAFGLRRGLVLGAGVVAVGTIVWWDTADAYYATPFRFGEVLAGAVIAAVLLGRPGTRVPVAAVVVAAAVIVGLTATLAEDDGLVATGALSVIAVASAVVVAWAATSAPAQRLLGVESLGWLGRRSYAVYLFHWPLLVLLDAPPAVAIVATLVLAELSHRVLESPIRSGTRIRRAFTVAGAATVLVGAAMVGAIVWGPGPATDDEVAAATIDALATATSAPSSTTTPPSSTTTFAPQTTPGAVSGGEATGPTTTTVEPQPVDPRVALVAEPTVQLIGDSTGGWIVPSLETWVATLGGAVIDGTFDACSPVMDEERFDQWDIWGVGVLDAPCRATFDPAADVVLVMDHGHVFRDHVDVDTGATYSIEDDSFRALVRADYDEIIAAAAERGATVVILTPPVPFIIPEILWEGDGADDRRMDPYRAMIAELADAHDHVRLLDVGPIVDDDPDRYPRSDGLHLDRDTGAVNFVVDLVVPAFRPAAG